MKRFFHSVILDDFREAYATLRKLRKEAEAKRVLIENNFRKISLLVSSGIPVKLEFGAGVSRGIEGWTYVDKTHNCDLVLDLAEKLPFPDNCVNEIYSSHLMEHFTYRELMVFLKECHRILAPDGMFSSAVPNARLFLESYGDSSVDINGVCKHNPALNGNSKIDYINYIAYMDGYHKYMFDEENLPILIEDAGFSGVRLRDYNDFIDLKDRINISIYVEAKK